MNEKYHIKDINIESTHIHLKTDISYDNLDDIITRQRQIITEAIKKYPQFNGYETFELYDEELIKDDIIKLMINSSRISDTGPMASVAGSISQICLEYLSKLDTKYSIIENGGDISLKTNKKSVISVYAGKDSYYNNLAFKIDKKRNGYGICTSSGTFGHSRSFGVSDATIVFSKQASIADGLATRFANMANGEDNEEILNNVLEVSDNYREYYDAMIVIKDDLIAKNGHIPELLSINSNDRKEYDIG
ncbi:MAG: UPF0280 family protein [Methanosphaera sp.]|nr:UPF0280 family protein [Methanosphaera sp.]